MTPFSTAGHVDGSPHPSTDILGHALHLLRLTGALYCQAELTAPRGVEVPALPGCMTLQVVTSGRCRLEVDEAEPLHLTQGSLTLIPHAATVGEPAMQYLTDWRMQLAHQHLRSTAEPLSAVARRFGYGSEAAFCRAFKRIHGTPPGNVRTGSGRDLLSPAAAGRGHPPV